MSGVEPRDAAVAQFEAKIAEERKFVKTLRASKFHTEAREIERVLDELVQPLLAALRARAAECGEITPFLVWVHPDCWKKRAAGTEGLEDEIAKHAPWSTGKCRCGEVYAQSNSVNPFGDYEKHIRDVFKRTALAAPVERLRCTCVIGVHMRGTPSTTMPEQCPHHSRVVPSDAATEQGGKS